MLIMNTSKSKFGEYRLGRVVAMEMDDDKLARTVLVKYSLIQHMSRKDRLSYKGIQIRNIRVAVQRLIIILPVEEQANIRDLERRCEECQDNDDKATACLKLQRLTCWRTG